MAIRKIKTINELQESGFGRPSPRHGLVLLYWFADQCISNARNDHMILRCNPTTGDFGFHMFDNRCDRGNKTLLPAVTTSYFEVGNLNSSGAHMLPDYVKGDQFNHKSNADRIIINVQGKKRFGKMYVTTHKDPSNFDPRGTFHISRDLIGQIKSYDNIQDFLIDTMYYTSHEAVMPKAPFYQMVMIVPPEDDCEDDCDAESQTSAKSDNSDYIEKTQVRRSCCCIIL